jgi:hypothetical protein
MPPSQFTKVSVTGPLEVFVDDPDELLQPANAGTAAVAARPRTATVLV